jgi:hypothetical protein
MMGMCLALLRSNEGAVMGFAAEALETFMYSRVESYLIPIIDVVSFSVGVSIAVSAATE